MDIRVSFRTEEPDSKKADESADICRIYQTNPSRNSLPGPYWDSMR